MLISYSFKKYGARLTPLRLGTCGVIDSTTSCWCCKRRNRHCCRKLCFTKKLTRVRRKQRSQSSKKIGIGLRSRWRLRCFTIGSRQRSKTSRALLFTRLCRAWLSTSSWKRSQTKRSPWRWSTRSSNYSTLKTSSSSTKAGCSTKIEESWSWKSWENKLKLRFLTSSETKTRTVRSGISVQTKSSTSK